ncbi:MAG: ABC transporter ATP-binding protein [Candidatus Methanomethylophilaceae archaeon]|jgi:ABC-2 type transport system ATP-binding protein
MSDIIEVRDLTRKFSVRRSPDKIAVDGISFDVKEGEIFGLLGPNGAGKTTTIKMLSTLLYPSSGSAKVLGYDITDERTVMDLRRRINVVSGGERGLYYRLTARQNLKFFSDLYGIPKNERDIRCDELLELVGLTRASDIRVEDFSRGMKQRLHIARALVNDPEVLYLDEPTIGLDPEISRSIRDMIRKLSDSGKTIILTTHYMYEAEELCDRMVILSQGKVVGRGTVGKIKDMVSDTSVVHILTDKDPAEALKTLESDSDITGIMTCMVGGRYDTRFSCVSGTPDPHAHEEAFRPFGIRTIGLDEPTLEDAYIRLTGGERE